MGQSTSKYAAAKEWNDLPNLGCCYFCAVMHIHHVGCGEQGWCSGDSAHQLPPMWPRIDFGPLPYVA